jgi:gamma-glutamylputrescine oxidase
MTVRISRDDLSFWVRSPDPRPCPALRGDERADVAIVGGGFAGLSAAYHLSRENSALRIVLLEANGVGSGASGRNTGILRPGVGGSFTALCRRHGEAEAQRLYRATVSAVDHVMAMIRSERLECEFEETHHVKGALTTHQSHKLQTEAELLGNHGFAANYYDGDAMASIAPVPYRGGLCCPQGGQLNPARLARELKRVALARGVRVYEHTPVRSIQRGSGIHLETPDGTVSAKQVVLATDVYAAKLGLLRGQILPIQTHVSLTEPLTDAQLDRLTWQQRRSFSDKRHIFNYYRLTRDNRIMFGGGRPIYRASKDDRTAGQVDIAAPKVWRRQERDFAHAFPALPEAQIEKQWAGTIGMTLDELPMIGELAAESLPPAAASPAGGSGVYFVGGWSGHGVHLATASGALVADLFAGRSTPETALAWHRNHAPRIPGDPLRTAGLSMYLSGLELADRLEAVLDRVMYGKIAASPSQSPAPCVQA